MSHDQMGNDSSSKTNETASNYSNETAYKHIHTCRLCSFPVHERYQLLGPSKRSTGITQEAAETLHYGVLTATQR